jgi:hypothetical protein
MWRTETFQFLVHYRSPLCMTCSIFHIQRRPISSFNILVSLWMPSRLQVSQTHGIMLGGSNLFSSQKVYKHLVGHRQIHPVNRWLWKSACQNKRNFFSGCFSRIEDMLSSTELLKRKNIHLQDYTCVLCHLGIEESLTHLFLACPVWIQC